MRDIESPKFLPCLSMLCRFHGIIPRSSNNYLKQTLMPLFFRIAKPLELGSPSVPITGLSQLVCVERRMSFQIHSMCTTQQSLLWIAIAQKSFLKGGVISTLIFTQPHPYPNNALFCYFHPPIFYHQLLLITILSPIININHPSSFLFLPPPSSSFSSFTLLINTQIWVHGFFQYYKKKEKKN